MSGGNEIFLICFLYYMAEFDQPFLKNLPFREIHILEEMQ